MNYEPADFTGTTSCGIGELARSSSFRNSLRRQREPIWIQNIRQQLTDQLKCLDFRLESHVLMLSELQDFYKRRAEVELEYSRSMDKLVKQIMVRHKADKQRRESWPGYSTYSIWQTLLGTTRKLGKDHGILGDLYNTQMTIRLTELSEDIQRVYKKCREMASQHHEELIKVLTELQSSMKTYHLYHGESLQAESKLRQVENQRVKIEQNTSTAKVVLTRRFRNFEKQSEKKQLKWMESRLKTVKARNEYLLCLEAANAAIQKYFVDDLQDLINTMDYGYHSTLGRATMLHVSAEDNMIQSRQGCLDLINQRIRDLNQRIDKQTFLELFNQPFLQPRPFEFQPHKGDEVNQLSGQKSVQDDLVDRLNTITERLGALRVENDEIWKTLETTDNRLLDMVTLKDYDVSRLYQDDMPQPPRSPIERDKRRSNQLETEEFYLNKFHDFQTTNNLIARLQAKYNCIEKALADNHCLIVQNVRAPCVPPKPKRRKTLGKAPLVGQPRLFGGTIEDYVEATGEDIPLVVRSCVRMINLYGMHHQGVFRVSGSQHEINEFKNQFERGKDPLPDKVDGKDINSVAGVLKLYFRELQEPLFPFRMFDDLVGCISKYSFTNPVEIPESISYLRQLLISSLPRPVIIVMRFLFAFLNHLSEFSDENMMDPYNLAICFGPTLLPVPSEHDQVVYQSHVNELVKNVIIHQEDLFTHDGGTEYERCLVEVDGRREESLDNLSEDEELAGDIASEEDLDLQEAQALYDFQGRTDRELSFKKGDSLIVYEKVSVDWWEGAIGDREGLLPDKYIAVRPRDKTDSGSLKIKDDGSSKSKSTESLPLKPFGFALKPCDDLAEMSSSHPNVHLELRLPPQPASRPPSSASSSSSRCEDDMLTLKATNHVVKLEKIDQTESEETSHPPEESSALEAESVDASNHQSSSFTSTTVDEDQDKTPEDLALDIDNALAEVMSGIHSLGLQHGVGAETLLMLQSGDFKHTPDLVIDLPVNFIQPPSPKSSSNKEDDSPTLTTAEVFANVNQCTIKKGTNVPPPSTTANQTSPYSSKPFFNKTLSVNEPLTDKPVSFIIEPKKSSPAKESFGETIRPVSIIRQHSTPGPLVKPVSPPPRTSSRVVAERISDPNWKTFTTDINLESEFVRSIISPFDALASSRRSLSPDVESLALSEVSSSAPGPSSFLSARMAMNTLPRTSPETKVESVKPPVKAKPPIMKKPARSNELVKRICEVQAAGQNDSNSHTSRSSLP